MTLRKLLVGAVSLVPGRVRDDIPAGSRARDEVEALLPGDFFDEAPFEKISLILRYGEQTNLQPDYQRRSAGILPITVELEMAQLKKADFEEVYQVFHHAILEAVIAVAERYELPSQELCAARSK